MNEPARPTSSEPATADELRDDIAKTRSELADSVDALSAKLDMKAQARRKLDVARARAGDTLSRSKQRIVTPVQTAAGKAGPAMHQAIGKVTPVARNGARQAKAHGAKVLVAAVPVVVFLVVRHRRSGCK